MASAPWDALARWMWALARGTVPSPRMLQAPAPPATPGRTILMPRRLAISDRAGMAILATGSTDADANIARSLSEFIPMFQSLYTDVFVLGYLQLLVTAEIGARLDELDDPVDHPWEFHPRRDPDAATEQSILARPDNRLALA